MREYFVDKYLSINFVLYKICGAVMVITACPKSNITKQQT